jgi:hypothetical protein
MNRIFALALIVCVGLECGCGTSKQQSTPPFPLSNLAETTWDGTLTGTNFVGTDDQLILNFGSLDGSGFCNRDLTAGPICVDPNISTEDGGVLCDGTGGGGPTGSLVIAGQQFTGTGSGTSGGDWTFAINGTVASGNQMSGTISFSNPGCGTAANPWTGTFTATLQQ